MLTLRRIAASVTQNVVQVYQNLSASLGRSSSPAYKSLPQHTQQDDAGTKPARGRTYKNLAYIVFILSTLFVILKYLNANTFVDRSASVRQYVSKEEYIQGLLANPLVGVFDPEPIRVKCDAVEYQAGLVWHCGVIVGGIGNLMNMLLNCVRYAMEAGATTLILPRLGARSNNLIDLGGETNSLDPSTSFDIDYFINTFKGVCPQIQTVLSETQISNLAGKPLELDPQYVKKFNFTGKYMVTDPTGWREAFDSWLSGHTSGKVSADNMVRVHQHQTLASWNTDVHTPEFVRSFPRLFQHPVATRRLAASVLWNLERRIGRPILTADLLYSNGSTVNSLNPGRLTTNGFMGAHLRVAADAVFAKFPGYESQAPFYMQEAQRHNLTTIYLATGSPEHRTRFREDAKGLGMDVYTKEDLLEAEELAELQSLTWDQQALIDYDVLLYSSRFSGAVRSSFSWLLVADRATLPEAQYPWKPAGDAEIKHYEDGLSAIAGDWTSNRPPVGTWPM